jgi:hypoxanthine phosphoribosyltransferase
VTDTLDKRLQTAKILVSAEQIQKRVQELARKISQDYGGRKVTIVCVLENGFIFAADLVRHLDLPVVCRFVRPEVKEIPGSVPTREIYFTPNVPVSGEDVLIVEAILQSGQTSEFLIRNMMGRGAASVKLVTLLDKQKARRVALQPDYFGFVLDESFVVGYGMGAPDIGRNLPYIAAVPGIAGPETKEPS